MGKRNKKILIDKTEDKFSLNQISSLTATLAVAFIMKRAKEKK